MDMPIIRFQITDLGHKLHAAIMAHGEEVADAVKAGVQKAADEMDIQEIARVAAEAAIRKGVEDAVTNYFRFGEGRAAIEKLVGAAVATKGTR